MQPFASAHGLYHDITTWRVREQRRSSHNARQFACVACAQKQARNGLQSAMRLCGAHTYRSRSQICTASAAEMGNIGIKQCKVMSTPPSY